MSKISNKTTNYKNDDADVLSGEKCQLYLGQQYSSLLTHNNPV